MAGAYENRPDRPIDQAFDHPGTTRRLETLTTIAQELDATRSEVVIAWLTAGTPAITPIIGHSTPPYLETALRGARLTLTSDHHKQLDEVW